MRMSASKNGSFAQTNLQKSQNGSIRIEAKKKRKETLNYKSINERFAELIKGFDLYGESVQLTFNGDSSFKTMIGALMSIMVTAVLLLYAGNLLRVLIVKSQTDVSTGAQVLDLDTEEPFRPQEIGFDFAFNVYGLTDNSIGYYTAKKFEYIYLDELDENGNNKRIIQKTDIPFQACSNQYFNFDNQSQVNLFGINNFNCATDKNYSLAGDYYSNYFSFVEIAVWKCQNGTSDVICKSQEEIDNFFDDGYFNLAFVNSIFSMNDYESPLQYYIDDQIFFKMEAERLKSLNMFIMKSQLKLQDSLIQFGQEEQVNYYQVQNLRYYDDKVDEKQKIIEVYLRFDKQFEVTQRQVYGILQLLGDVGGLQSCLFVIGLLFVAFFQRRLFVSSIIKEIYQIRQSLNEELQVDQKLSAQSPNTPRRRSVAIANKIRKYQTVRTNNESGANTVRNSAKPYFQIEPLNIDSNHLHVETKKHFQDIHSKNMQSEQEIEERLSSRRRRHSEVQLDKQQMLFENENTSPAQREQKLQQKLKTSEQLKLGYINMITKEIISRKRLWYKPIHILSYLFSCMCFRNVKKLKTKSKGKPHFYYNKADSKLQKELDIVTLLRTIRNMKLILQVLLSQRHRMLLRFQRQHVIETDSSPTSDSDDNQFDTLKLMEHKNPIIRLMIYGKLKRMMVWFLGKQLGKEDKNLLRGIFKKKIKDFDEDYLEKHGNKSLIQRLKQELVKFPSQQSFDSSQIDSHEGLQLPKKSHSIAVQQLFSLKRMSQDQDNQNIPCQQITPDLLFQRPNIFIGDFEQGKRLQSIQERSVQKSMDQQEENELIQIERQDRQRDRDIELNDIFDQHLIGQTFSQKLDFIKSKSSNQDSNKLKKKFGEKRISDKGALKKLSLFDF